MKVITNDDLEKVFLTAFSTQTECMKPGIDWADLSHESSLHILFDFLRELSEFLPDYAKVNITHGMQEDGLDIILDFPRQKFRIGWQIKSYSDHESKDFLRDTLAQITRSKKYDCNILVVVHATDPICHKNKIRNLSSEIGKCDPDYLRIINPDDFGQILSRPNWPILRTASFSRLLGPIMPSHVLLDSPDENEPVKISIEEPRANFSNKKAERIYNAGMVHLQQNRIDDAEKCFKESAVYERNVSSISAIGSTEMLKLNWLEAIRYFDDALAISPMNRTPMGDKAICLSRMGYMNEAIELAKKCLSKDSQDLRDYMLLARILRRAGSFKESYETIETMMKSNSGRTLILPNGFLIDIAGIAFDFEDFGMAKKFYCRFIQVLPNDYRGYWGLGMCLQKMGLLSDAVVLFRKSESLKPDSGDMLFHLGNCLRDLGRTDEAIMVFERAKDLLPNSIGPIGNLACLIRDSGRVMEALECFDDLARSYPSDPLIWENRGLCLAKLGKMINALSSFKAAIKLSSDPNSSLLNNAGLAAMETNHLAEAERFFKAAEERDKSNWMPHANRGRLLMKKEDFNGARDEFLRSIDLGGKDANTLFHLGASLFEIGEMDKARTAVADSLSIDRDYAPSIGLLGVILAKSGESDEARIHLEKALSMEPSLEFAREALAKLRKSNGQQ